MYYNVRTKGHFEQSWRELYSPFHGLHSGNSSDSGTFILNGCPAQSNNVYTVITYSAYSPPYYAYPQETYPPNAQVDFQISAVLGHDSQIFVNDHPLLPMLIGHEEYAIAFDIQSDWSNTQTITISNSSLTTSYPQNQIITTPFAIPISTIPQNSTPTPTSQNQMPTQTLPPSPITPFPTTTPTKQNTANLTENDTAHNSVTLPLTSLALIIAVVAILASIVTILVFRKPRKEAKL